MTPFHIDLVRTLHEDQRRRLSRRPIDTDVRTARPKRRRARP
jgi:hypothetical protein